MNKKQAIERIQELVATEEINKCLEILRQPITLADFLGWEEDKVYIFDNYKLKISNGSVLYFSKFSSKWEIHIPKNIIDLRKAILEVQE
jgi:hypothetical protein